MDNSHKYFEKVQYKDLYKFIQKYLSPKSDRIVGIKDIVRYGQILKEVELLNTRTRNKYKMYLNAFGRCYPSSSGEIHSYIYVEDENFERVLPKWFQMMHEANDGVEWEGSSYPEDFYEYYNISLNNIFDRKFERLTKRDNYTDEQLDNLENARKSYYNKICGIVGKYLIIEDRQIEEVEENINYDDMTSDDFDM